jgi:hypothetical protein
MAQRVLTLSMWLGIIDLPWQGRGERMDFQKRFFICLILMVTVLSLSRWGVAAGQDIPLFTTQSVYVPVYSHIYIGNRGRPFQLSATLSIRNTDLYNTITVTSADYYDTQGKLVQRYIQKPILIKPMGAENLFVKESDTSGGAGANFVVRWKALKPVNEPIIESIMIGASSGQGISFVSRGKAIQDQR